MVQLDSVRLLIAVGRFSLPVPDLSVDARAGLHVDLLAVRAQLHAQVRVAVPQRLVLRHRNTHVNSKHVTDTSHYTAEALALMYSNNLLMKSPTKIKHE